MEIAGRGRKMLRKKRKLHFRRGLAEISQNHEKAAKFGGTHGPDMHHEVTQQGTGKHWEHCKTQ